MGQSALLPETIQDIYREVSDLVVDGLLLRYLLPY